MRSIPQSHRRLTHTSLPTGGRLRAHKHNIRQSFLHLHPVEPQADYHTERGGKPERSAGFPARARRRSARWAERWEPPATLTIPYLWLAAAGW